MGAEIIGVASAGIHGCTTADTDQAASDAEANKQLGTAFQYTHGMEVNMINVGNGLGGYGQLEHRDEMRHPTGAWHHLVTT